MASSHSIEDGLAELALRLGSRATLTKRDKLFFRPEVAEDVVECLQEANRIPHCQVSVVGGDHSGYAQLGHVVVEMVRFKDISVDEDARTVTVGGGVILAEVAKKAMEHGLVVSLGTAPTVGVGLMLQGGIGHLTRRLGVTLDSIVAVDVVTASGTRLQLDRTSEQDEGDLFWAIRGCGPNFAVVLSLILSAAKYLPCETSRLAFLLPTSLPLALPALESYAERAKNLPRDCSSDCVLFFSDSVLCGTSVESRNAVMGVYDYNYGSSQAPLELKEPVRAISSTQTFKLSALELMEQEPYLNEQPRGTLHPELGNDCGRFIRCVFIDKETNAVWNCLLARFLTAPSKHCCVHLQHAGGAVADHDTCDSAFHARSMEWSVVVTGCWSAAELELDQSLADRCRDWVMQTMRILLPYSIGTYPTDLGPDDVELARASFGLNAEKLQRLKLRWDPSNMFGTGFPLARLDS